MAEQGIHLEEIFAKDLSRYGTPVAKKAEQKPDSSGRGFSCWYPLVTLSSENAGQIGLVLANLNEPLIDRMEAHPIREEWVYAIDKPIIQVVALTSLKGDFADPFTARAILLNPGEGFLIRAGVWHAPAFAADLRFAYYGFVLPAASADVHEMGLVPLEGGTKIRITL